MMPGSSFLCMTPLFLKRRWMHLETVAELTSRVMCDTLQEYFPVLRPQVEVNISRPDCWNKDGDGDELERWIESLNELMNGQEIGNKEA